MDDKAVESIVGRQRVVRMVYEVVAFQGDLDHRRRPWRNPDEDLPADFETRRAEHYASLRKPLDPAAFITSIREEMRAELDTLHDAHACRDSLAAVPTDPGLSRWVRRR